MLIAFFLQLVVAVHRTDDMFDIVDKAFAIGKAAEQKCLPTMRTLGLALFDPRPQAVLAGELAAGGTHPWLFHVLEADVTLQES